MLINRRALKQNHSVGEKRLKYTGLLCYMEDFGMGRTYWTHESEYILAYVVTNILSTRTQITVSIQYLGLFDSNIVIIIVIVYCNEYSN